MLFAGQDINKSPYSVNVSKEMGDPSKVHARGPGLDATGNVANKPTYFDIYTAGNHYKGSLASRIITKKKSLFGANPVCLWHAQAPALVTSVWSSLIHRVKKTPWSSSWKIGVTVFSVAPIAPCWRGLTPSTCCLPARRFPRALSMSTSRRVSHLSVL